MGYQNRTTNHIIDLSNISGRLQKRHVLTRFKILEKASAASIDNDIDISHLAIWRGGQFDRGRFGRAQGGRL